MILGDCGIAKPGEDCSGYIGRKYISILFKLFLIFSFLLLSDKLNSNKCKQLLFTAKTDIFKLFCFEIFCVGKFQFSCCSWGSQDKNTEVVCHSLLQSKLCFFL